VTGQVFVEDGVCSPDKGSSRFQNHLKGGSVNESESRIGEWSYSYLPDTVVKAEDQAYLKAVIAPRSGKLRFPNEMRRLKDNDAVEILTERVVHKVLDRAGLKPPTSTTSSPTTAVASTWSMVGTFIHHKFKFREETPVLNISQAARVSLMAVKWPGI